MQDKSKLEILLINMSSVEKKHPFMFWEGNDIGPSKIQKGGIIRV